MKGISTNREQVAVWIQSYDAEAPDKTMMPNRYKEEVKRRRELDAEDRPKILRALQENSQPLTTETGTLHHIINGQVADEKVNVQDALKIDRTEHEHTILFLTS